MSASEELQVTIADPGRFATDCRALWLHLRDHHGSANPEMGPLRDDDASWERAVALYGAHLAEPDAFLVLAEEPGADGPAGCAVVTVPAGSPTWATSGRYGYLELISVDPARRGLGVGTRLLDAVQAELDRLGAPELRLTVMSGNLGAQAFYRELGFDTFALDMRRPAAVRPPR